MAEESDRDAKAAWVLRVLSVDVTRAAAAVRTEESGATKDLPGLSAWQAARAAAVQSLQQLEVAFRAMKEPEVPKAIILVRAIRAQLTERPDTMQKVQELQRFIEQDQTVSEAEIPNGFGFKVSLRAPLLAALSQLRPAP